MYLGVRDPMSVCAWLQNTLPFGNFPMTHARTQHAQHMQRGLVKKIFNPSHNVKAFFTILALKFELYSRSSSYVLAFNEDLPGDAACSLTSLRSSTATHVSGAIAT